MLDQAGGNRQAQAGAAIFAPGGTIRLREGLEDHLLLFLGNADAGVPNGEVQRKSLAGLLLDLDLQNHFAAVGELDGIAQQIHDHLPQPRGIAHDLGRNVGADVADQLQPFCRGAQAKGLSGLLQSLAQVELRWCPVRAFPASILEKSRMSLMTVSSESADVLTMLRYSRCSAVSVGFQRQLRHADDAVHGRADFVAHVGQELALGAAGGLGGFLGLLQLLLRRVCAR